MKILKLVTLFSGILFLFTSCEDVIELDLASTEPRLVIESTLDVTSQNAQVIITRSNDFYDDAIQEKVSGAKVTLTSSSGKAYVLSETTTSDYLYENIDAEPGESFTLKVEVEGQVHQATAKVPHPASLNEIEKLEGGANPFGGEDEGSIMLAAIWEDPAGIENFYRIRTYVNDEFQSNTYTVLTDDFRGDGSLQNVFIQQQFTENTTVEVELLSTDERYYDYFFQVSSIVGEGFNSSTPYNPTSSFDTDALGYFGIYHSSVLTINL